MAPVKLTCHLSGNSTLVYSSSNTSLHLVLRTETESHTAITTQPDKVRRKKAIEKNKSNLEEQNFEEQV